MIKEEIRVLAKTLRRLGKSHRQISKVLEISLGSAFLYTKGVRLTKSQHLSLMRANLEKSIKSLPPEQLREASRRGGQNTSTKFRPKYSKEYLIEKIRNFYQRHQRIPTKREFNSQWQCYLKHFGCWNQAVIEAGFRPNPELFAKKWVAKDGHKCDSLSEKIIDDLLNKLKIVHQRNIFYPNQKKFTVDFLVSGKHWVEFLGLKDELKSYDSLFKRKKRMAAKSGIRIVEVQPSDLFPVKSLERRLEKLR